MAGFSTESSLVIEKNVSSTNTWNITENFIKELEFDKCAKWIKEHGFKKVCLQFPDEALVFSQKFAKYIESATDSKIFILADTSYASCCVDSVAAAHVDADAIIHFGSACLTPHRGIPVLYIFQPSILDVSHFCDSVRLVTKEDTFIFYDTKYHHYLPGVKENLRGESRIFICEIVEDQPVPSGYEVISGRVVPLHKAKDAVFLGSESMLLTNLTLLFSDLNWYIYENREMRQQVLATNKFLMKRLHLIEKLKDATAVGILVGTLSVDGALEAVDRVRKLCKQSGKKCYTMAVGRPNVAKLANFPEIEIFVLVSCPENKLLTENSDFYQPIVSLLEVEIAFGGRKWSPEYTFNFRHLQPEGRLFLASEEHDKETQADLSLITGKIRHLGQTKSDFELSEKALLPRDTGTVMVSNFLSEKSWRGLEQKLGETAVEKASQGRRGIPLEYENEGVASASSTLSRKLKLLCLHGYRQDGAKLRQQTGALRKLLKGVAEFEFISAPFEVPGEAGTSRSWWFTKETGFSARDDPDSCTGLEESLNFVEETWAKGEFDGLFGFSQGACLVSLITAMCAKGILNMKPDFVVIVCGFKSKCKAHTSLYPSVIGIPSLHVFGETDQVIPCKWSEELAALYEKPVIIRHSGGHFIPGNSYLKLQYHEFFLERNKSS